MVLRKKATETTGKSAKCGKDKAVAKVSFVMADLIRQLILSAICQCSMRSRVKPGMTG